MRTPRMPPPDRQPVKIDMNVAHTARVYDYLLDGTDNFAVDREVAQHAFAPYPGGFEGVKADAKANRAFLGRAIRFLAGEAGIRQFLDIGTGIPNADNTHAVAQQVAPGAKIVYVDNDPIVLAHAHTLKRGLGSTQYIDGDFRYPEALLDEARRTLDFSQPVAVVLVGLLHVIPDADDPYDHVATLVDAVCPGSYLALSHITSDIGGMGEVQDRLDEKMRTSNPPAFRSHEEIERFFEGVELVEPGLGPVRLWRPDEPTPPEAARETPLLGAVGRKP